MRDGLAAIAALLFLSGCGALLGAALPADSGRLAEYPVSIEKARRILAQAKEPPLVFGSVPVEFSLAEDSPTRLVWTVSRRGAEVMRYTADISEAGDGKTRVSLDLAGATGGRFGDVETRLTEKPALRKLYLVAMQERIAADLEARPYRMDMVYPHMTQAAMADIGSINERFDAAAAEYRRRDRDNIDKAYQAEAAGKAY